MQRVEQNCRSFDMFECSVAEAAAWGKAFVHSQAPLSERPAVVFDIDDTLVLSRTDAPNQSIVALYNELPDSVRRSIVTARPEEAQGFSKQQIGAMVSGGSPAHMYHMPDQYLRQRKVECYKRNCRRQIEQDGDILLNIGDQWSDVLGTKRVLNNALDLEEEGHLSTVKAYVIVAKSDEGRSYLASRAGIKLPG